MAFGSSFSLNNPFNIIHDDSFSGGELEHPLFSLSFHLEGKKREHQSADLNSQLATHILRSREEKPTAPLSQAFTFLPSDIEGAGKSIEGAGKSNDEIQPIVKIEQLEQQIEEMNLQAALLNKKIENFFQEVKGLEEKYDEQKIFLKEQGSFQGSILATLEYFKVNQDNFLTTLSSYLSYEEYNIAKEQLKKVNNTFKWTNCIGPLIFHIAKFCVNSQIKNDLDKLQERFQELKLQKATAQISPKSANSELIDLIQYHMDQLKRQVIEDQEEALVKGRAKLDKLAGKFSTIPLEKIGGIAQKKAQKIGTKTLGIYTQIREMGAAQKAYTRLKKWAYHLQTRIVVNINCPHSSQQQLYRQIEQFVKSLEQCKTRKEVQQKLKEVGIKEEIPPTFEGWQVLFKTQRFRRYLIQSYCYSVDKRPFMNAGHIERILDKHEADKARKIDQSFNFIDSQIEQCRNLDFDQITAHFKKLHIHFDRIQLPQDSDLKLTPIIQASECIEYQEPPKNKDEWDQCIQDPEFCKALAEQWVDYQETTGQLAMQMMRQALLSKNQIERKFLFFRWVEYVIKIASTLLQLAIYLPQANLLLATSILELFVSDLTKIGIPGVGLTPAFHPLYPDMSFKIDSVAMTLVEHFFAIKYKPHEYSLDGYQLTLQIRWFGLVANFHYLISLFKQILLWMNMRLIENCVMRLEKKPLEEDSRYIQINEVYERNYLNCKHHVKDLKVRLNQLRLADAKLAIHPHHFNALQVLVDVLKESNFEYFPEEVHEFFEDNLGLKLTTVNKNHLKRNLEQLFSGNENKFANSYQATHWSYLRV